MNDFVVHGTPFSPYVQAVRITLFEKGEAGNVRPVTSGMKTEPHISRHPFGKVPVLEHGDFTLYETQAILRYLDRLIPSPALMPADLRRIARMDQVMNITDDYLMNGVNRIIGFHRVVGPRFFGLTPDEAAVKEAMPRARTLFKVLNDLLAGQGYFAGDEISLADIMVVPQLNMLQEAPEWGELIAPNPHLMAWQARMNTRGSLASLRLSLASREAA